MVRLAPRDAAPCGYAGQVEMQLGNRDEAIAYFKRALFLDPSYPFGANSLLALYWEKRDASELKNLPSILLQSSYTYYVSEAALAFAAVLDKNKAAVKEHLGKVVRCEEHIHHLSHRTDFAFENELKKFREIYRNELEAAVADNQIGPVFAAYWMRNQFAMGKWECWKQFKTWIPRMGQLAVIPVIEYLDSIAEKIGPRQHLLSFVKEHGDWLRTHTITWGKVGYALVSLKLYEEGVLWLKDHEKRSDVEGWMLANLMLCYLGTEKWGKVYEPSFIAVQRGLIDSTWGWHIPMAALGKAMQKDVVSARAILEQVPSGSLENEWMMRGRLAGCICNLLEAPEHQIGAEYKKQFKLARDTAFLMETPSATLMAQYRDAMRLMAEHAGVKPTENRVAFPHKGGWGAAKGWFWPALVIFIFFSISMRHCAPVYRNSTFDYQESFKSEKPLRQSSEPSTSGGAAPQASPPPLFRPESERTKEASDWFQDMMKRREQEK